MTGCISAREGSTSAQGPTQFGPIQKRTEGESLQFLFPSHRQAAVFPSAILAKNRCSSIRMSSSPKVLHLTGCFSTVTTEKLYKYPKHWWGNCIFHLFLLICPGSELISEICNFQCLEHGPTESHVWLLGNSISAKARNVIL